MKVNIYQTINGGLNWTLQFNVTAFGEISEVHFACPERGWAVGDGGIELDQNYPNPFNPSTTIRYWVQQ